MINDIDYENEIIDIKNKYLLDIYIRKFTKKYKKK